MLAINLLHFLAQSTLLKTYIFAPLYATFLVLVLLITGQQGLNLLIDFSNQQAADCVNHTLLVEREGERLLNAVLDEERTFLNAYTHQQFAFTSRFNSLYTLEQKNPEQLKQLEQIKNLHERWQSELNQRILSGSINRYAIIENSIFDSLRTQIQVLIQREEILFSDRKRRLQQLYYIKTAANIFSTVVILAVVGLNVQLLYRRIEIPLRKLIKVGEVWQVDKRKLPFDHSSRGEIVQLTGILDVMADEVSQRQKHIEVRNQQLEDLICALSHDLRTPLLATRTTLDSMLKGAFGYVSDTWREVFQEYRQANDDLLKLVEALLDVSRYESVRTAHLNSDALNWEKIFVKTIAQIKATSKNEFIVNYNISQSLPTVYGDELEIQRVLQNLLDNAVRVSQPNKEIFLEVTTFKKTQVQVSVRDQGPGIAPQHKEQLFHRFVQGRSRRGRAGLGLYLCRQIIEAHGGTINVESTVGEGSTFWFTLPIAPVQVEFQHKMEM